MRRDEMPNDQHAERAYLCSCLLGGETNGAVKEEDFYLGRHGKIFSAMQRLCGKGVAIDLVTLRRELEDAGELDKAGGEDFLLAISDAVPTPAGIGEYEQIIKSKSRARRLIIMARKLEAKAEEEDAIDFAGAELANISRDGQVRVESMPEVMKRVLEEFEIIELGKNVGLDTGFPDWNKITGGITRGELMIIAGRTSMGKTTLATNLAANLAERGAASLFFSYELQADIIGQMLTATRARVSLNKIKSGFGSKSEFSRIYTSGGELAGMPIFISDDPRLKPEQIRLIARRYKETKDIQAVFVDFLTAIPVEVKERQQRREVYGDYVQLFKRIAMDEGVAVIITCQISRDVKLRRGHEPQLFDLAESGLIEQYADCVMLLHRPDYYRQGEEKKQSGQANINIAKNRLGPTRSFGLYFDAATMQFRTLEKWERERDD